MLSAIAGYDPRDATSSNAPVADYAGALTGKVRGTTIGVPRHFFTRPETGIGQESLSAIEIALRSVGRTGREGGGGEGTRPGLFPDGPHLHYVI